MELMNINFESFLENNRISADDWSSADINWDDLKAIGLDHQQKTPGLIELAEFLTKTLQKCNQVHSVRWRIKDPEHLMTKIIRKRAIGSEKYNPISVSNYAEIVTDLIGIRVLHLFKYEWKDIHDYIMQKWEPTEKAVAYIRKGDEGAIVDSYNDNNCNVLDHNAGYRSIHYEIPIQLTKRISISEIQVRTIFEEGWSEIDHKIRYPNFSDNELISYFLTIFNRMAGSADEMGTFVKNLSAAILLQENQITEINREQEKKLDEINREQEKKLDEINRKQEQLLSKIETLAAELSKEQTQSKTKDKKVIELKNEIANLRNNSSHYAASSQKLSDIIRESRQPITTSKNSARSFLDSEEFNSIQRYGIRNTIHNLEVEKLANSNSILKRLDDLSRVKNSLDFFSTDEITKIPGRKYPDKKDND